MSQPRIASSGALPALYRRIGYAPDREAQGLLRLAAVDVPGCRKALGELVDGLDLTRLGAPEEQRQVGALLLDVLQRINRRIHRSPRDEAAFQIHRLRLIEEFAGCVDAEEARTRFLPALQRLLVDLRPSRRSARPLVERARSFIEDNYQTRIYLSSVAHKLNVSPNYLSRLFRRETGITLTAYIQGRRLEHARMLLAEGKHSISEIAYRVGYQNYRDFYRNFVKQEKASPREVQRRLTASPRLWKPSASDPAF